jgi:uncharacterized membrane protein
MAAGSFGGRAQVRGVGCRNVAVMRGRWETTRTEAFSDGVFAIATTLLVLDIGVPTSELRDLWSGIGDQWPAYLSYATSFITIGGIWLAHHAVFRRLRYANAAVMRINLALLMAVALLPFPTMLVAEALRYGEGSERATLIFYGASLLAISLLFSGLWRAVVADRELLRPEVGDAEVQAIGRATAPNIAFYAVVVLVAILAPRVAAFGYLVLAILVVAIARSDTVSNSPREPRRGRVAASDQSSFSSGSRPSRAGSNRSDLVTVSALSAKTDIWIRCRRSTRSSVAKPGSRSGSSNVTSCQRTPRARKGR